MRVLEPGEEMSLDMRGWRCSPLTAAAVDACEIPPL